MQRLEKKRKSARATLQYQRDHITAEHDEAPDRANILFAQLRNQRRADREDTFRRGPEILSSSRCSRSTGQQPIEPLAKDFSLSADPPIGVPNSV
jgi:hypothetical protein